MLHPSSTKTVLLTSLWLGQAMAADDCPATLRMAYNTSWLPYVQVNRHQVSGSDIELAKVLAAQAGTELQLLFVPESRAIQQLRQGEIDVLFAASFTKERSSYAWFSKPYRQERNVVLTHRTQLAKTPALADRANFLHLASRRLIGTFNPAGFYGDEFEQIKQLPQVQQHSLAVFESDRRLQLVLSQRADYTIVDEATTATLLLNWPELAVLPFVLNSADIHLMLSKKTVSAGCVDRLDAAIIARGKSSPTTPQ